ncbi:FadR/GntR family transcriptional regulator [Paraglaciecola sp.]|uniref:FadR/GntR family transcriptional regulator n=1 Tax=Paraglaciecola sp. TaxID=1920173 RepID=UPI0030F3EDFA
MANKTFSGNFTRHIVQSLGKAIALGEHPQGEPLQAEALLCGSFEASRTVLREAVKMLTAKGMLDARPRRGTIVLPESQWNLSDPDILNWMLERKGSLPIIAEFVDMRLAIEPAATGLAALNLNNASRQTLNLAIARMEAAANGEDDHLDADIAFHVGILEASNNRFFWNMRHTIEVALRFSIRMTNRFKGVGHASVDDHRQVLNFILAGDQQGAEDAMRALLNEAKTLINNALADEVIRKNKN